MGALALSGLLVVAGAGPATATTATYTSAQVGSSGQTPQFTQTGNWTMAWSYNCSSLGSPGNFSVTVNQPSGDPVFDAGPDESGSAGTATDYYSDSGTFSLSVTSTCAWSITVSPSSAAPLGANATFTSMQNGDSGNTAQFTESGNWSISWSFDCSSLGSEGVFGVFVNQPSGDATVDIGPSSQGDNGNGSDFYTDTGTFGLAVMSDCAWSLIVAPSSSTPSAQNATFTSSQTGDSGSSAQFSENGSWTLAWSYDCIETGSSGAFTLFINQPPGDQTVDAPPNEEGTGGSGSDSYTDTGVFSLSVLSDCSWSITVSGQGSPSGPGVAVTRIFGTDAVATAIAISQAQFPSVASAKAVVLARSDFYSDALAGGPLAAAVSGPLLITPGAPVSSSIDPRVLSEIQRVLPPGGTVYVLGGDLALAPGIDSTLEGLGYKVTRVEGSDEYATAVAIAGQLGDPQTVFEATGTDFADALSAVPAAISMHGAILLTDGPTQAPETASYLAAHPSDTRYAIGGSFEAAGADPSATAVYGTDLYGTSAAVAAKFFPEAADFGAATGASFDDALAGGVLMGSAVNLGPMLLVAPSGPLPPTVSGYLSATSDTLGQGYLFGGSLAVGNDVLSELESAG